MFRKGHLIYDDGKISLFLDIFQFQLAFYIVFFATFKYHLALSDLSSWITTFSHLSQSSRSLSVVYLYLRFYIYIVDNNIYIIEGHQFAKSRWHMVKDSIGSNILAKEEVHVRFLFIHIHIRIIPFQINSSFLYAQHLCIYSL